MSTDAGITRRSQSIAVAAMVLDVVVAVLAIRQQYTRDKSSAFFAADLAGGVGLGVAAFLIWRHRPANRCWWFLLAASTTWWIGDFEHHLNRDVALFGFAFGRWYDAFLAAAVLAYPNGRLHRTVDRIAIGAVVALSAMRTLSRIFLFVPGDAAGYGTSNRFLPIDDQRWWRGVEDWHARGMTVALLGVLAIIVHRMVTSAKTTRQVMMPALVAAAILTACVTYQYEFGWNAGLGPDGDVRIYYLVWWAYGALGLALAWGLVRLRRTRSAVVDVFAELHHEAPPGRLGTALGRALGDKTLTLLPWSPSTGGYVDSASQPVDVSVERPGRAVTLIEQGGEPMAALMHDSALLEDPGLVNAVVAAVRLTIDNEQLQGELEAQLAEVAASRARIVAAGDAERRRIERDLHDGAQQRLVASAVGLQLAMARLADSPDDRVREVLEQTAAELRGAIQELRDLAHGIHPSVLTEFGLGAALESLVNRSPLNVSLSVDLPSEPEGVIAATAYYAVAEALTNAMKHANAEKIEISAAGREQSICIEIEDDGDGGADIHRGTGMAGIADRIASVGGSFAVDSALGAGTRLVIELPCVSS